MAESNPPVMSETEILKEALLRQQQHLQQLYSELELEREASASAASEALSMILRLQGEKASLDLEAGQFKRMAEERMYHAEEALAIFEEVMYQREMEVASLEYQVQAYRYKLLSMGCNDFGVGENKFSENLLRQKNDLSLFVEKGINKSVKRLSSMPQFPIVDSNFKTSSLEMKRSVTSPPNYVPSIMEEITSQEADNMEKSGSSATRDVNMCWEEIKNLDKKVKEISDFKDSGKSTKPEILKGNSWTGRVSGTDQVKLPENLQENEATAIDSPCASSVQDIFEVPQVGDYHKTSSDHQSNERCKLHFDGKGKIAKADGFESVPEGKKVPRIRSGINVDCNMALVHEPVGVSDLQVQRQELNQRVERLERVSHYVQSQEISGGGREEELELLKEISEQIKCMQSEIKSLKANKLRLPNEPFLDLLQEAMVYFWF